MTLAQLLTWWPLLAAALAFAAGYGAKAARVISADERLDDHSGVLHDVTSEVTRLTVGHESTQRAIERLEDLVERRIGEIRADLREVRAVLDDRGNRR